MGLDQYLYARTYLSAWNHERKNVEEYDAALRAGKIDAYPAERIEHVEQTRRSLAAVDAIMDALAYEQKPEYETKHTYVELQVGYWRKVNALHGFIVRTFADGVDECQPIRLSRANLRTIFDATAKILAARPESWVEEVIAWTSREKAESAKVQKAVDAATSWDERAAAYDAKEAWLQENPFPPVPGAVVKAAEAVDYRPTAGFFFGETEFDYWFYGDLLDVHRYFETLLADPQFEDEEGFTYRASW